LKKIDEDFGNISLDEGLISQESRSSTNIERQERKVEKKVTFDNIEKMKFIPGNSKTSELAKKGATPIISQERTYADMNRKPESLKEAKVNFLLNAH